MLEIIQITLYADMIAADVVSPTLTPFYVYTTDRSFCPSVSRFIRSTISSVSG